jgi:hypothetical protein
MVVVACVAAACLWAMWQNHAIRSIDDCMCAAPGMKIATTVLAVVVFVALLLLPRVGVSLRYGVTLINAFAAGLSWESLGYVASKRGAVTYLSINCVHLSSLVVMDSVMAALYVAFIARPWDRLPRKAPGEQTDH